MTSNEYLIDEISLKKILEVLIFASFTFDVKGTVIKLYIEVHTAEGFVNLV